MAAILAADNTVPFLAVGGQIAAIIICFFVLVFVIIAVAFNVAMAMGLSWVREKSELIKKLRPYVDSVNKTTEAAERGVVPAEQENAVARNVARVPVAMHETDQKVDQISDTVAEKVIEFRARTVQAKTIIKAFFLPGLNRPAAKETQSKEGLEFKSPGYRILMEEERGAEPASTTAGEGYVQDVTNTELRNAPVHR